ncbi:MAG TPA: TlpA disulfide reductase family protein [Candidatus Limnocylindrales bacterium]|nr:TlpA disulfide reductase family protein [Candidatus Limnocylindrales bacterium]
MSPPVPRRRRGVGPFSLRQVAGALGVVVVAAVVLTVATAPLGTTTPGLPNPAASAYLLRSPVPGLRVGDLAPELAGTNDDGSPFSLADLEGNPIRLADLRGRAVWVNFWASWCPPCQSETPILREIDERYRDRGLTLVAIQVQQTVDDGLGYAERYELEYAIGADVSGVILHAYRVYALPTQFFIDPGGVIRAVVNGPLDLDDAAGLVESVLPAPGASPSR